MPQEDLCRGREELVCLGGRAGVNLIEVPGASMRSGFVHQAVLEVAIQAIQTHSGSPAPKGTAAVSQGMG